jgi:hypothetical protein
VKLEIQVLLVLLAPQVSQVLQVWKVLKDRKVLKVKLGIRGYLALGVRSAKQVLLAALLAPLVLPERVKRDLPDLPVELLFTADCLIWTPMTMIQSISRKA